MYTIDPSILIQTVFGYENNGKSSVCAMNGCSSVFDNLHNNKPTDVNPRLGPGCLWARHFGGPRQSVIAWSNLMTAVPLRRSLFII